MSCDLLLISMHYLYQTKNLQQRFHSSLEVINISHGVNLMVNVFLIFCFFWLFSAIATPYISCAWSGLPLPSMGLISHLYRSFPISDDNEEYTSSSVPPVSYIDWERLLPFIDVHQLRSTNIDHWRSGIALHIIKCSSL